MSKYSSSHIETELADARRMFTIARTDDELQPYLATVGMSGMSGEYVEYVEHGETLLDEAQHAYDAFVAEHEDVDFAHDLVSEADGAARSVYSRHIAIARAGIDADSPLYGQLGLKGRRRWTSRGGWLGKARQMYTHLAENPSLLDAVDPLVIDVEEGLSALQTLNDAIQQRLVERGEAEQSTQDRNDALSALRGFVRDFKNVAQVALRDAPQQGEKLLINAPSA